MGLHAHAHRALEDRIVLYQLVEGLFMMAIQGLQCSPKTVQSMPTLQSVPALMVGEGWVVTVRSFSSDPPLQVGYTLTISILVCKTASACSSAYVSHFGTLSDSSGNESSITVSLSNS
jgi:hypothetical protein